MTREDFSKATQRYLNNGWIIKSTNTYLSEKNEKDIVIEFGKWDDTNTMLKALELSSVNGVRIKCTDTNWNYTEWNEYTNLTACL